MATPSATTAAAPAAPQAPRRQFLIVNNVQKIKNIKNMLVSASSFGVREVFVVGQKKFELSDHELFLRSLQCPVTRMQSLAECRAHCVAHNIRIVGVEIMESAKSILDEPFQGDTAFIMGNEGSGMNASQVVICDDFVIIPQYGGGTASLNVTVAASIIMHSFAVWAQIPEAPAALAAKSHDDVLEFQVSLYHEERSVSRNRLGLHCCAVLWWSCCSDTSTPVASTPVSDDKVEAKTVGSTKSSPSILSSTSSIGSAESSVSSVLGGGGGIGGAKKQEGYDDYSSYGEKKYDNYGYGGVYDSYGTNNYGYGKNGHNGYNAYGYGNGYNDYSGYGSSDYHQDYYGGYGQDNYGYGNNNYGNGYGGYGNGYYYGNSGHGSGYGYNGNGYGNFGDYYGPDYQFTYGYSF